ncbi:MAG: PIN domain-containing protein [Candidatus Thermoplasmatota archaeon]
MMDTSVLVAALHAGDENHNVAQAIWKQTLSGKHGRAVSLDHVLDEGLTLLRRRPGREDVSRKLAAMFVGAEDHPPLVALQPFDRDAILRALNLHFERYDRGLSFTDCALVVLAQDLGCPIASFDTHFDGIVRRVSS